MLTDDAVRAELERIDPTYAEEWDECQIALKRWPDDPVSHLIMAIKALRLLAESQQALREIGVKFEWVLDYPDDFFHYEVLEVLKEMQVIASNAVKGGTNG